jgi:flagellar biosynthesis protein FlhA
VRKALGRGIIKKYLTPDNQLVMVSLDRATEDVLIDGQIYGEDGSTSLKLEPTQVQKLLNNIAESIKGFDRHGPIPILLCGPLIRWELRKLIRRYIPGLVVLAYDEIPSDVQTKSIGTISMF